MRYVQSNGGYATGLTEAAFNIDILYRVHSHFPFLILGEGSWMRYIDVIKRDRMTEKELRKLEGTIRMKMEEVKNQRVSLKDSGLGGLMNSLKKVDEALYEKIFPEYKKMVTEYNIFK